jgi:hypothetical protein
MAIADSNTRKLYKASIWFLCKLKILNFQNKTGTQQHKEYLTPVKTSRFEMMEASVHEYEYTCNFECRVPKAENFQKLSGSVDCVCGNYNILFYDSSVIITTPKYIMLPCCYFLYL